MVERRAGGWFDPRWPKPFERWVLGSWSSSLPRSLAPGPRRGRAGPPDPGGPTRSRRPGVRRPRGPEVNVHARAFIARRRAGGCSGRTDRSARSRCGATCGLVPRSRARCGGDRDVGEARRSDDERMGADPLHPYQTERILARRPSQPSLGSRACTTSGRTGPGITTEPPGRPEARLLTVADIYAALTQDRPHRPARPPDQATAALDDAQRRAGS